MVAITNPLSFGERIHRLQAWSQFFLYYNLLLRSFSTLAFEYYSSKGSYLKRCNESLLGFQKAITSRTWKNYPHRTHGVSESVCLEVTWTAIDLDYIVHSGTEYLLLLTAEHLLILQNTKENYNSCRVIQTVSKCLTNLSPSFRPKVKKPWTENENRCPPQAATAYQAFDICFKIFSNFIECVLFSYCSFV